MPAAHRVTRSTRWFLNPKHNPKAVCAFLHKYICSLRPTSLSFLCCSPGDPSPWFGAAARPLHARLVRSCRLGTGGIKRGHLSAAHLQFFFWKHCQLLTALLQCLCEQEEQENCNLSSLISGLSNCKPRSLFLPSLLHPSHSRHRAAARTGLQKAADVGATASHTVSSHQDALFLHGRHKLPRASRTASSPAGKCCKERGCSAGFSATDKREKLEQAEVSTGGQGYGLLAQECVHSECRLQHDVPSAAPSGLELAVVHYSSACGLMQEQRKALRRAFSALLKRDGRRCGAAPGSGRVAMPAGKGEL